MNIQLPGYETKFKNEVYLKDSELAPGNSGGFKDVLLLRRYTFPSEEQIEKYLVKAINTLTSKRVRPERQSFVETAIEKFLLLETRQHLGIEKCRECLDTVKMLSPGLRVEDENQLPRYLEALYGVIPAPLLEYNLSASRITEGSRHEMFLHNPFLIKNNLGLKFTLSVELEDGVFPHHYKKKILFVGAANQHKLENLTEILKCNFDTAERVNALQDVSEQKLEMAVIRPLLFSSAELNSLSAKHLAETGKMVKSESIERKADPLFTFELFKKSAKSDNKLN